jgi:hypothetical protein
VRTAPTSRERLEPSGSSEEGHEEPSEALASGSSSEEVGKSEGRGARAARSGFPGSSGVATVSRGTGMSRGITARRVAARRSVEAVERPWQTRSELTVPTLRSEAHGKVRCEDLALPGVRERELCSGRRRVLRGGCCSGAYVGRPNLTAPAKERLGGNLTGIRSVAHRVLCIGERSAAGKREARASGSFAEARGSSEEGRRGWNAEAVESSCTRGRLRVALGEGMRCSGCRRRKCLRWPG